MNNNKNLPLIVILGPTATGKTKLAVQIANFYSAQIISADSRQVYKGMDIGTGKDLEEYIINDNHIPYHLIDILYPKEDYSVFQFQKDFFKSYNKIIKQCSIPLLCGGTGLYIESILLNYKMSEVIPDYKLRSRLELKEHSTLKKMLKELNSDLHNSSDLTTKKRTIRAIEIGLGNTDKNKKQNYTRGFDYIAIGIAPNRSFVRKKITERLKFRLENGLIEEVNYLLKSGLRKERLNYFGLEYKLIGKYLDNQFTYNDMFQKLNSSIHQFAKRQMTFFRRMEKRGVKINWIEYAEFNAANEILSNYSLK